MVLTLYRLFYVYALHNNQSSYMNIDLVLWSVSSHLLASLQFVIHFASSLVALLAAVLSDVSFALPFLIVFVEEWQRDYHFMCTFDYYYFSVTKPLLFFPKRGVQDGAFFSRWVSHWQTYSYSSAALVTRLKPSIQSCGLWQPLNWVNQTRWLLLYLSISLTALDIS